MQKTSNNHENGNNANTVLPPVFSFGEKGTDQWYAHEDGVHIPCDETIIDKLWWQWIIAPTAERADDDKYTIFKVTEPGLVL